jgi:3D (Asp-Asp-Asp) domain-containing protein
MRKKLIILGFALAAAAASTLSTAAADPSICPSGTRVVLCTTHSGFICCPDNAFCAC